MTNDSPKSRQFWTQDEVERLRQLAQQNVPTEQIAQQLGRSERAIYSKASDEGISLRPRDMFGSDSGVSGQHSMGEGRGRLGQSGRSSSGSGQSGMGRGGRR